MVFDLLLMRSEVVSGALRTIFFGSTLVTTIFSAFGFEEDERVFLVTEEGDFIVLLLYLLKDKVKDICYKPCGNLLQKNAANNGEDCYQLFYSTTT
jgi:hypothetical protein